VALAGDVVDQDNGFFESIGPLQTGFDRLRESGIEVFLITGNHDYKVLPQVVGTSYDHVHLLGRNGQWEFKPFTRNNETVLFLGWSYPTQYVNSSPMSLLNTDQLNGNFPVIGLLHADLDNVKSLYCPVGQNELIGTGVGTWILGHVHKPGAWSLQGTTVHYPGSLQALSAKESGAHGFLLLTVNERKVEISRIQFSTVRYQGLDIDISKAETQESLWTILMDAVMDDARGWLPELNNVKYLSYDIRLVGEHADEALVVKWAEDSRKEMAVPVGTGTTVSVRSVTSVIRPVVSDLTELAKEPSPAGALAATILAIREGSTTPLLKTLEEQWEQQRRQLRTSGVYQPLLGTSVMNNVTEVARVYLLRECNHLLNVLLSQTQKTS
jgi:DNA repair protein SbcD/Mre11